MNQRKPVNAKQQEWEWHRTKKECETNKRPTVERNKGLVRYTDDHTERSTAATDGAEKNKTNKQKNNNNPKPNLLRSEFLKYQNECEVCGEIIILLKLLLLKVLHKADIDPLKNTNTHSNLNRADNKNNFITGVFYFENLNLYSVKH